MQITIRQHSFNVRGPYAEGTILTKAEAQALNGLRAENIRNNMAKLVLEYLAQIEPGRVLPAEAMQELQGKITDYDLRYQFTLKHESRQGQGQSPIDAEILLVATEATEAMMRRTGKVLSANEFELSLAATTAQPEIQAEARRRLALANQAAAKALEDLL